MHQRTAALSQSVPRALGSSPRYWAGRSMRWLCWSRNLWICTGLGIAASIAASVLAAAWGAGGQQREVGQGEGEPVGADPVGEVQAEAAGGFDDVQVVAVAGQGDHVVVGGGAVLVGLGEQPGADVVLGGHGVFLVLARRGRLTRPKEAAFAPAGEVAGAVERRGGDVFQ